MYKKKKKIDQMSKTEIKNESVQLLWPHGLTLAGKPYGLLC